VSVVDFTNLPTNVNNLRIEWEVKSATNGSNIGLQTYGADGNRGSGANDYSWWSETVNTSPADGISSDTTSDAIVLPGRVSSGAAGCGGRIDPQNIQAATYAKAILVTHYLERTGTNGIGIVGWGQRLEADRIGGFRLFSRGGNIPSLVTVYYPASTDQDGLKIRCFLTADCDSASSVADICLPASGG